MKSIDILKQVKSHDDYSDYLLVEYARGQSGTIQSRTIPLARYHGTIDTHIERCENHLLSFPEFYFKLYRRNNDKWELVANNI